MIDKIGFVNRTAYMDFKKATDELFDRVDHEVLAKRLGVSIASIRQARLKPEAGAHRAPPSGWRGAVAKLAIERAKRYQELANTVTAGESRESRIADSYSQAINQ